MANRRLIVRRADRKIVTVLAVCDDPSFPGRTGSVRRQECP